MTQNQTVTFRAVISQKEGVAQIAFCHQRIVPYLQFRIFVIDTGIAAIQLMATVALRSDGYIQHIVAEIHGNATYYNNNNNN